MYPDSDFDVSVVIATLGEAELCDAIDALNEGILKPKEILLCLPTEYAYRLNYSLPSNVRIIECDNPGQVAQRITGFSAAQYPYVLQIDSDIKLHNDCLSTLVKTLHDMGGNNALSPFLHEGVGCEQKTWLVRGLQKTKNLMFDGRINVPNGWITKSGVTTSPYGFKQAKVFESQWLNGVVLHHRSNLLLANYYPFAGKAYNEDVIHSILLRQRGVKLWVCNSASGKDLAKSHSEYSGIIGCARYYKSIFRTRALVIKLSGGSFVRMYLVWQVQLLVAIVKCGLVRRGPG